MEALEEFESLSDREIARMNEVPETEVEETRRERGFLRLDDFEESGKKTFRELTFELDEMRRRQLQGFVGEKICSLMSGRVTELLTDFVRDDWVLKTEAEIVSDSPTGYTIGSHPGRDEIEIDGSTVKHFDASEEEIIEKIRERCFKADRELFKTFHKIRNPWIDFSFYALKTSGTEEHTFTLKDFSESALDPRSTLKVDIPVIEDFKVVALEVKTTKGDGEKLLSENQRDVLETAEKSPYIDFYTLKIDTEFSEMDIPENYRAEFKKHS